MILQSDLNNSAHDILKIVYEQLKKIQNNELESKITK